MSRVGQISIARPGGPLQLRFDERDLGRVIESEAQPGDHISLYPGNYTIWDEDDEIFIESGINVTILPGAKVDYVNEFRNENFTFDENPADATDEEGLRNHPLATGGADRYLRPNFVGHTENIVDLNLGSEWAFERDVEKLRSDFVNIDVGGNSADSLELNPGDTIEFRGGSGVSIESGALPNRDGIYIEIKS